MKITGKIPALLLTYILSTLCTPHAFGQVHCAPNLPSQCSTELEKQEPAPFAGILLTPELALSLNEQIETSSRTHAAEIRRLKDAFVVETTHQKILHKIQLDAGARREAALKRMIEQLQPKWYEHPLASAVIVILSLGLAGGIAGLLANAVR